MQDYWWVTRPKRKLNPIPEELAAFCSTALGKKWTRNRDSHIEFEVELEQTGTKRVGERRDASGSGGRTHAAMLYSLGLWFEKNDTVFLTLAGEAIMEGKSPVPVLKKQVLRFQYPSAYSASVKVAPRFKIRPFYFLLKLLLDERLLILSQREIALIVAIQAENESDKCYNEVVEKILQYRSYGDEIFESDYLEKHNASEGNLMDVANTMMNWLDYTQLVYREKGIIGIPDEKREEVEGLVANIPSFIQYPVENDVYQRKYGVDPWHQKDTRNLLNTTAISSKVIDRNRILRAFFNYSSLRPVSRIDSEVVDYICNISGTDPRFTESVLIETYPHGSIGSFMTKYFEMAFKGRDEATEFEKSTVELFRDVFGYETKHVGPMGLTPDVLLVSPESGYQAIIDNKAYSNYSINNDHRNRMVHNYLTNVSRYSDSEYPMAFFTYIAGGFGTAIDKQIESIYEETGVRGSVVSVTNIIKMVEKHQENAYTHQDLRNLFGLNRQILMHDL